MQLICFLLIGEWLANLIEILIVFFFNPSVDGVEPTVVILNRFFFFLNSSVSLSCKACFDFNDTRAAGVEEGDLEDELLSSDLR